MKPHYLKYLFNHSVWLVLLYRISSLILKRLLYRFQFLFFHSFSYCENRTTSSLTKLIDFDIDASKDSNTNLLVFQEHTLFGHHHVRHDHLKDHIYHYPSSSYFLSSSYPHYTRNYVNLYDSSDVKYTWEYGRLQWLVLSCFQHKTNSSPPDYSNTLNVLTLFFEHHPCSHGIHWSCTMDVSFRALSLLKI